jgi:hypothetical protein
MYVMLLLCAFGQCRLDFHPLGPQPVYSPYQPSCMTPAYYIVPGPEFVPLYSPWNVAVAELRARRAMQPKAIPTSLEWNTLTALEGAVATAKQSMVEADKDEKADCRHEYYQLRAELDSARLKVARDMHRRRRNGTEF